MPNIIDFTQLYRRTKQGVGLTGSTVKIELKQIKPRIFRTLTHVSVENQTNDYTKCRLGISTVGRNHYLDEISIVLADQLVVSRSDVLLGEGDIFFAELTGTTTDDILIMTCVGWEMVL